MKHIRADITLHRLGKRPCGGLQTIPLAGRALRPQVVEAATMIEVDHRHRLVAPQLLALGLEIGTILRLGIDPITLLRHHMRDPGRLLVVALIREVGMHVVVLMQGTIDDILHHHLSLLHEGLEIRTSEM
jgi:hypothetical protein